MRPDSSAFVHILSASTRALSAAVPLAIVSVPPGVVFAQAQPGYPAAPGTALPGTGSPTTGPTADTPQPRRGGLGWWSEFSLNTQATLTNNANYGESSQREGDLIIELTPAMRFNREGARLRADGFIALNMIGYVNGVQTSRILPQANIFSSLEAVENIFFVDSSIVANQSLVNPFLPRADFSSTNNQYTYAQARLRPYLKSNIGPYVRWLVSSDNAYTWTTQSDQTLGNSYFVQNLAEVARVPTPFGVTLRLTNDLTRYQGQIQPDQTLNTGLAIFDYAFTPRFTFGLRVGYEKTNYTTQETAGPIYGANLAWKPTPTSSLVGYWEERFYGPSYQFLASHRQRRLASSASFYRTISTNPQLLLQIPATTSVSGMLDVILTARFPDPIERAQAAQDLITRQGLPESLPAGAFIYNQSINTLTGGNVTWALIGVRNTLALNVSYLKTEALPDAFIPPTFVLFNNNIQQGGGITLSHTLTPLVSLNCTLSTIYTRALAPNEGQNTRQGRASVQSNWQVSPRSTAFVGSRFQYQNTDSPALAGTESSEFSVFAGLFHRF